MTTVNASPVALLVVILSWSFWAVNFRLSWGQYINKGQFIQGFLYIIIYQPIFFLCIWSYWTVCKTSPGFTLDLHRQIKEEDQDQLLQEYNLRNPITVKRDGARRFCQKCKLEKFD
ncbi:unnamed protein product [Rhizopus stolonifer]